MAIPTHVTVTAPEGRMTPIHPDDGVDAGNRRLFVEHGFISRVRWTQTTRRARNRGDLILCNMSGEPVDSAELATSRQDLPERKVSIATKKKGA